MTPRFDHRPACRCAYVRCCYMAEALSCYGFKTDCVLYQKSNGQPLDEQSFHAAMDRLIDKTKAKYAALPR